MAQLQIRSDDTIQWAEGYGNGQDGDLTISGATNYSPTKTTGTYNAAKVMDVASNASFSVGEIVLIHQTRHGSIAGTWQLNKITSKPTSQLGFKYDLVSSSFSSSGDNVCQIIKIPQYRTVNINAAYTLPEWDDSNGGSIGIILANTIIQGSGSLNGDGKGFKGAVQDAGGNSGTGLAGESYADNTSPSGGANNEGGGGGGERWAGGGGGGGGGAHAANGTHGNETSDGSATTGGDGGASYGQANLVKIYPGSGGGAGGGDSDNPAVFTGAPGGDGGGAWILIAPQIDLESMTITNDGANGTSRGTSGDNGGGGGGGAGGSALIKGDIVKLGTNRVGVALGSGGAGFKSGGDGAVGRIAVEYGSKLTGSTTPSANTFENTSLVQQYGNMVGFSDGIAVG